ncbi:mitochondrial ribosomal protein L20 isoform X2 [Amblyomma americanum]
MVFLTALNLGQKVKSGSRKFWKRQRIFQLSANFYGRRRNCFRLALRSVEKALTHSQAGRRTKRNELSQCKVALDRHILADITYTEPRTFKGLATLARFQRYVDTADKRSILETPPEGVFTRGML